MSANMHRLFWVVAVVFVLSAAIEFGNAMHWGKPQQKPAETGQR